MAAIAGVGITVSGAIIHALFTLCHKSRAKLHKRITVKIESQKTKEEIFFLTV